MKMLKNSCASSLLNQKTTNYRLVFLLSLLITTVSLIPVLVLNNGNLYLFGDYMTQQIPFIKECRRVILSGTPFWSVNTFLGANFIGTYSFYVYTSPFFWPLLLVPEQYLGTGLAVMFILKHIAAALFAHLYISKYTKNQTFAVIGSLMYAFSSFSMDSSFYYHFLEVIAFFPLLLYLTDRALENKSKSLFMLVVLFTAILNFYFFVSTSFLFLFYVIFKIKYSDKLSWKDGFRTILFYGIGALGSAIILLPSGLCMLETSKVTMSYSDRLLSALLAIPQSIKVIEGIVLPSEGILGSGIGFKFAMYSSNAAFLPLFGAFFLFIAVRKKEKVWDYKLIKFLLLLSFIPFGNGLFSLFSNMTYTRWWYGFVLISIIVSFHIIEDLDSDPTQANKLYRKSAKSIAVFAGVVILLPLILKLLSVYLLNDFILKNFPKQFLKYLKSSNLLEKFTFTDLRYAIVLVLLTAISYLSLYIIIKKGYIRSKSLVFVMTIICIVSYGSYLTNECITYKDSYKKVFTEEEQMSVNAGTDYTSRIKYNKSISNFSMISNTPGIDTFHTVKSKNVSEFGRIVGYECGTMPTTNKYYKTQAIQSVLSVSGIMKEDNSITTAPYYVPMGFVYEYYIEDTGYEFTKDYEENDRRIQLMTQACFIDKETAQKLSGVLEPLGNNEIKWQEASNRIAETACTDFVMNTAGFSAVSQGDKERLVYFSIPNDNGWTAYINGKETEIYTVNGGLIGIVVPEGTNEIQFEFMPPGLILGAMITAFVLLGIAVCGGLEFITKKKNSASSSNKRFV